MRGSMEGHRNESAQSEEPCDLTARKGGLKYCNTIQGKILSPGGVTEDSGMHGENRLGNDSPESAHSPILAEMRVERSQGVGA